MINIRRLTQLIIKEFNQLKRDPRMVFIVIAAPVIQLFVFGYIATFDIQHIPSVACDLSKSSDARQYLQSVTGSGYFDVDEYLEKVSDVGPYLASGKAKVAFIFPEDFSKQIKKSEPTAIQILVDGTDSNTATIALGYIGNLTQQYSFGLMEKRFQKIKARTYLENLDLINVSSMTLYNPELKSVNYMVPAIIGMVLIIETIVLTVMAVVKEKETGTLEQLLVTPIRASELILSKIIPSSVLAYLSVILVILVGNLWFRVPMRGDIFLLLVLAAVFLLSSLALGLSISTNSQTQKQATMTAFFFLMPNMILSGFIFPIENMPGWIQIFTYLIPLRYFLIIVRGIFLKGVGLDYLWPQALALVIFSTVTFAFSVLRFRKKVS